MMNRMSMNKELRQKLGLVAGSVEMNFLYFGSWMPNNQARIAALRLCGAKIGKNVAIHHGCQVRMARKLSIGDNCFIAEDVILDARGGLSIGDNVSINSRAQVWTAQHDWRDAEFAYVSEPVTIGNRAWISAGVKVLPGVEVGEGAVAAAGALVAKSVEPFKLVGGVPAKVLADRPRDLTYQLGGAKQKPWWW